MNATTALEAPTPPTLPDSNNSLLAVFSHVGGLFTSALAPLVLFLIARSDPKLAFATHHAREALNFQITLFIAFIVLLVIPIIGWVLLPALFFYDAIFVIIAAIKTVNGEHWRYPLILHLIK